MPHRLFENYRFNLPRRPGGAVLPNFADNLLYFTQLHQSNPVRASPGQALPQNLLPPAKNLPSPSSQQSITSSSQSYDLPISSPNISISQSRSIIKYPNSRTLITGKQQRTPHIPHPPSSTAAVAKITSPIFITLTPNGVARGQTMCR